MKRGDIFPSRWLTAADLPAEGIVVTIHHLEEEKMRDGVKKPVIFFEELDKGMVCNVTNWNVIESLYGEESDDWADERIMLYPGETTFDGDTVACIRVKKKKPKASVTVTGNRAKTKTVTQAEADAVTGHKPRREPGDDDDDEDPVF